MCLSRELHFLCWASVDQSVRRQRALSFTTDCARMSGEAPTDRSIRLGGMVVEGSIERSATDLETTFWVTDYEASVPVRFSGILPDLFAEGEGVVAEGTLDESGMLLATQVLAKHDENYMPPEVAAALEGKTAPLGQPVLP